jgi:hypothetical protein
MRGLNFLKGKAYQAKKGNSAWRKATAYLQPTCSYPPRLIRLSQWCKENNYSRDQALGMIKRRELYCIRQNKILWVATRHLPCD